MKVRPYAEPSKVKLSGPSLSEKGVPASIPTTIKIDTNEAGYGDLEVRVIVSTSLCAIIFEHANKKHFRAQMEDHVRRK